MQILVVAATPFEIAPLLQEHPATEHLITGVGAPVSIYQILRRLHQIDYDLVIQAGIAGSFSPDLPPGEVVLIKNDHFADLGVMEKGHLSSLFDIQLADPDLHPFHQGTLSNPHELLQQFSYKKVNAVTVNLVTDNPIFIGKLMKKYGAQVETMEGAALHYTCLQENIPFLQLRCISNRVGERDKTKWKMNEAVQNLHEALMKILNQLNTVKP